MEQLVSGFLRVAGEMVSIVLLAVTGRFIGFAQSTLESGKPLSVDNAFYYVADTLGLLVRPDRLALMLAVLSVAALIRIGIAHANRSVLLILKNQAGIDGNGLSWEQRAVRLPVAVLYRVLSGIATLIGGFALALSFRLFNPEFGPSELWSYVGSLAGGLTYATLGAILVLLALYGVAVTIIGYIASPAILTRNWPAVAGRRPALPLVLNRPYHCRRRRAPAQPGVAHWQEFIGVKQTAGHKRGEQCKRERRVGYRYFWHSSCCFYSPICSQD